MNKSTSGKINAEFEDSVRNNVTWQNLPIHLKLVRLPMVCRDLLWALSAVASQRIQTGKHWHARLIGFDGGKGCIGWMIFDHMWIGPGRYFSERSNALQIRSKVSERRILWGASFKAGGLPIFNRPRMVINHKWQSATSPDNATAFLVFNHSE